MAQPEAHRPIADYALIGNTHTAALIGPDGSIDWCCLPHFDSGAVFCRLLDLERGGSFRVGPVARFRSSRRYREGCAILETEFESDAGRLRLTDFMHSERIAKSRLGHEDPQCHRILRRLDGIAGAMEVEVTFRPTFDFARVPVAWSSTENGVLAESPSELLQLRVSPAKGFVIAEGRASARLEIASGERVWLVLSHAGRESGNAALAPADPDHLLEETERHWREWEGLCSYEGPYRTQVRSSARVLKLLTYGPTGALIASPTASLPEKVGGMRNWDYRFCWLRDSALVLHSLMALGYHEGALDFFQWLERLCEGECEDLQIVYRLDGGRTLPEFELAHLSGYRESRPVRIGNGAAGQTQIDVYGHVLDAAWVCLELMPRPLGPGLARVLAHLADQAAKRWREPDQGIWETRGPPRHFVSSKLMCWVALDRALRLVESGKLEGDDRRWRAERDALRAAILSQGFDATIGAFTQSFGSRALDASVLLMPLVHFLPADDPRMRSTVERIRRDLTDEGLVYRYLGDDGLAGGEATFAICSFWLVNNLALQGRPEEARALFEHVTSFGNDVGLFAEEIDPTSGELLGNYPQGYTHLALIKSALTIAEAERGGRTAL